MTPDRPPPYGNRPGVTPLAGAAKSECLASHVLHRMPDGKIDG